ncbi:MAG: rhodanese-like domain-containing protein [Magnetococcales bacterium]|nr:rhodanese-like domain-containing protein [Magnetococcales bacterium]MBF0116628.1 rhodanese-like domain-containing protein [Magnetococcales bacterium]
MDRKPFLARAHLPSLRRLLILCDFSWLVSARKIFLFLAGLGVLLCFGQAWAGEENDPYPVKITANLPFVDLPQLHNGKDVRLQRDQNPDSVLDFDFSYIARKCPPFCIQPMTLSPGVETIGELEVIDTIKRIAQKDNSFLLIDSRTDEWLRKGMIPGAVSIPWTKLHHKHTDKETLTDILEMQFGVVKEDGLLSFQYAKTLVFYCNGNWCGQSPTSIRSLLLLGYPPHKLKWYRDGMQGWMMLGLTTVTPAEAAVKVGDHKKSDALDAKAAEAKALEGKTAPSSPSESRP